MALSRVAKAEDKAAIGPTTLREIIDAAVEQVLVFPDVDAKKPAQPLVALRWSNNVRGSGVEEGATVLYIHAGRPLAVACVYPWDGRLVHNFELLASERIVARRDHSVLWQPQESAIEFADVPQAPPPEATAAQRLRQMKSLAGQFQSTMLGLKSDDTDREELRLLPRPLYRYELDDRPAESGTVSDGAVFAFVMGTDPESLLLLEAVKEGDASKWRYAFARRTSGELQGRHRGKVVWTADRFYYDSDNRSPHYAFGTPLPPDLLDNVKPASEVKK